MQQDTFTIKLTQFEGPFDLLLFFIERDELNIYDIPISKITEDFLAYIREMERLNIDLASEFILVAATLMRIKAKMLIPRKEIDEEGNEIDPRDELVARLIEYKRYKAILEDMRGFEENRGKQFERGNISSEMKKLAERALIDAELESLTLFKLLKAFGGVLERMEDRKQKAVHKVYAYAYTIPNQQVFIFTKIREGKKTSFKEIFGNCENRMHAIITFLALLELLNMQKLRVTEGGDGIGVNVMVLEQPSHEDDVMTNHEGEEEDENEDVEENAEENEKDGIEEANEDTVDREIENETDLENADVIDDARYAVSAEGLEVISPEVADQDTDNENISENITAHTPDAIDSEEAFNLVVPTIDIDSELEAIQALVEQEESESGVSFQADALAPDSNVVDLDSLVDNEGPTTEPTNKLNSALEDMIDSAIEVGSTDITITNNSIKNFSEEE